MARPRRPKETADDTAYREVGQAIESVQQELEQLRHEGAARAPDAARGAALIGGAGALGLVSIAALGSLPLRRVMPAWLLALAVAGGSAAGAAALGRAGFGRLAAIAPEALEQRAKEAVENIADAVG
jgi:hypothetical protein